MIDTLRSFFSGTILLDEPLQKYTSFHIGGPARFFLIPHSITDITKTVEYCQSKSIPFCVLGHGTNVLVSDSGFDGVIIHISNTLSNTQFRAPNLFFAESGLSLQGLIRVFLEEDLTGFSFLAGIPGTVGGATAMNAGTNRGTISSLLDSVTFFDGFSIQTIEKPLLDDYFTYRNSIFLQRKLTILSVVFRLNQGNVEEEKQKITNYLQKRRDTQPICSQNAGCFWKNPPGQSAGSIIEGVGLKGKSVGDAKISDIHANFLLNCACATAAEILDLARLVEEEVFQKTGILLEREIQQI